MVQSVLLVEDDELNQLIARTLLGAWPVSIIVASHGQQAIDRITDSAVDLILMDLVMPVLSGIDATRTIRRLPNGGVPIVAMTSTIRPGDEQRFIEAGINDWIAKPVGARDFATIINRWLPGLAGSKAPAPAAEKIDFTGLTRQGFNTSEALANLLNNGSLYTSLLRSFCRHRAGIVSELDHELQESDLEQATTIVHSLKSTAAALGMDHLSALASNLESNYQSGRTNTELLSKMSVELGDCLRAINFWLSTQPSACRD